MQTIKVFTQENDTASISDRPVHEQQKLRTVVAVMNQSHTQRTREFLYDFRERGIFVHLDKLRVLKSHLMRIDQLTNGICENLLVESLINRNAVTQNIIRTPRSKNRRQLWSITANTRSLINLACVRVQHVPAPLGSVALTHRIDVRRPEV